MFEIPNPELDAQMPVGEQLDRLLPVAKLVEEYDEKCRQIEATEELLSSLKKRKAEIETAALPVAMTEAGISAFKHVSGRSVTVKTVCQGNIPAETSVSKAKPDVRQQLLTRRLSGLAYVRQHWPGLIKTELNLSLPKGEAEVALRIAELIRNQFKLTPSVAEIIHPATLNSHFKELMEQGKIGAVPADLFALYIGPIATIK